jgi:hypothetical protein
MKAIRLTDEIIGGGSADANRTCWSSALNVHSFTVPAACIGVCHRAQLRGSSARRAVKSRRCRINY